MPIQLTELIAFAIGIILLFAIIIIWGLRAGDRMREQALQDIDANATMAEFPEPQDRSHLLYGIWEVSTWNVTMIVKDGNDQTVGNVTLNTLGHITFQIGDNDFNAAAQKTWLESSKLYSGSGDDADDSKLICTFERKKGWRNKSAEYKADGLGVIKIPIRYGFRWKQYTIPIEQDGTEVGQLLTIGLPTYNKGKALLLSPEIPLAVRIFILVKGAGKS